MNTATSPKLARRELGFATAGRLTLLVAAAAVAFGAGLTLTAGAQEATQRTIATGTGIPLATDAPDRYTVKQGDTLWDISSVFLRDPWYWPEIWYLNPQVKNPHLIFPGDVLALTSVQGQPQVTVAERGPEAAAFEAAPEPEAETEGATRSGSGARMSPRVRSTPITAAVTAIPYDAVAAFMNKPSLLTKAQVKSGPYLMGVRDSHLIGGEDNEVYARGLPDDIAVGARYNYVHIDIPIYDPETNKLLGYRGIYSGSGLIMTAGNPAKLSVDRVAREVLRGDKLFAEEVSINLDFVPHPVPDDIQGSIAALSDVMISGAWSVATINRGTKHGIESGHVFRIDQRGEKVKDVYKEGDKPSYWSMGKSVRLPNERIGVAMVFKAYDNMSYALIMRATHPVRVGDLVAAP